MYVCMYVYVYIYIYSFMYVYSICHMIYHVISHSLYQEQIDDLADCCKLVEADMEVFATGQSFDLNNNNSNSYNE